MACGLSRSCIEQRMTTYLRRIEREAGGSFTRMESLIAKAAGTRADGVINRDEISYVARASGATSGSGFVHKRVVGRVLDALDQNRDGVISAREWMNRHR